MANAKKTEETATKSSKKDEAARNATLGVPTPGKPAVEETEEEE